MGICFKDVKDTDVLAGDWWPVKGQREEIAGKIPPIAATGLDDPLSAFLKFFKTEAK